MSENYFGKSDFVNIRDIMGEDVESVMGGVRMGVNVDIKRTDGEYRDTDETKTA